MAKTPSAPAPKLNSTRTRPIDLAKSGNSAHEEELIDEAVDESFPASDPPAIANPSSTLAVKHVAESGRGTPEPEPDPGQKKLRPHREK
jgi:hypothetical protein